MSPETNFLLEKAKKYCAYQERCMLEIKTKLQEWQATEHTLEKIIHQLEKEDYLNEERYAIAFALGKLRNNRWGKNKIYYALMQKGVPELYIQMGLNEIDEEEYIHVLKKILSKKVVDDSNEYRRNNKLVKYAVQKGFQSNLVWKVIRGEV